MRIYTISNKRVWKLQKTMKTAHLRHYWKEGMEYKDMERLKDDILDLWGKGNVRYWKAANSYILNDFSQVIPNYNVYCITKEEFHNYFKV